MPHIFKPPLIRRNNLTVTGKSASSWDWNELDHFGVFFKYVDFNTFFRQGLEQPPEPIPDKYQTWLATTSPDRIPNRQVWHIIEKLRELHLSAHALPTLPDASGLVESLTNQLATALFDYFDYISPGELVCRTHLKLPFVMCGDTYDAKLDTVILDANMNHIFMGFQHPPGNVTAQLIPKAISAFVNNDMMRSRVSGSLGGMLIPFITMRGSTPTFYLVPITQKFVNDVAAGRSPAYETVVLVYEPIPRDSLFVSIGLAFPDSRILATRAFLEFKQFLRHVQESAFPCDYDPKLHAIHPGDRIL